MPLNQSRFSHHLRRELNAIKAGFKPGTDERSNVPLFRFGGQTLLLTISHNQPGRPLNYEFWQQDGTSEGDLASPITVKGPVFSAQKPQEGLKAHLATISNDGKVRVTTGLKGNAQTTRLYLSDVIHKFWKKIGIEPYEAEGWSLNTRPNDGWAYVSKRMSASAAGHGSVVRDIAILAAEMPGRKIQKYNPSGTRLLTYDETQKLNIPGALINHFEKQIEDAHYWHTLTDAYNSFRRRINAWEDGPGRKYFALTGKAM